MQNGNLPVDGWRARVRAGATVAPGKSCHSDHEGLSYKRDKPFIYAGFCDVPFDLSRKLYNT